MTLGTGRGGCCWLWHCPFPSVRLPLGCVVGAGSCLELLPPPGLPNLPSPFHQHPVFTWLQNPHAMREEEEGGEPLPLPLWARGTLLRR